MGELQHNLFLYQDVLKSLKQIKNQGTLIIGFTESKSFFTKYRIKHLDIDGLIDYIYAPIDFGAPESVSQVYPESYWEPEITEFRYLSNEVSKPKPEILEIIIKDFGAEKNKSIYIGDKLNKDISMANDASIDSVHAKYGEKTDSDQYSLLREVTHWTDEQVEREKKIKKENRQKPIAKFTLEKSFNELFNYFSFRQFKTKINKENFSHVLSIWEKSVDVQQHFNDIELKIRNIALTVFTFIIVGVGYSIKEDLFIEFDGFILPFSSVFAIIGIFIMFAFFYMDREWYHKLLHGAVKHGSNLEKRWNKYFPELRLTQEIGNESPHRFLKRQIHSRDKYWFFYGLLWLTLFIVAAGLILYRNWELICS
jgi:FMN phosphatase YigB (HAD superfamily)